MSDMIPAGLTRVDDGSDSEANKFLKEQSQYLQEIGANTDLTKEYLKQITPELAKQTDELSETLKNQGSDVKEIQKGFLSGIKDFKDSSLDKIKSTVSTTTTSLVDGIKTPLSLITDPLQELTGINVKDSFKKGISSAGDGIVSLFKGKSDSGESDSISSSIPSLLGGGSEEEDKKRIAPRRTQMLKYGIEGASAVYLADTLLDAASGSESVEAEGGGGILSNMMSRLGVRGGGRGLGGMMGRIGPALAAAGPWVALAATIAGTAIAFKNEWDKEAESMGEEIRDVWNDENATFLQKMGVTLKNAGKGIFGALAGGVRGVTDGVQERVGNIRGIWQDEERGLLSKIGGTVGQTVAGLAETGFNFVKGFGTTIFNGVVGLFPDEKQERIRAWVDNAKEGISNFFGNAIEGARGLFTRVREGIFGSNSRTARELFEGFKGRISGFLGNVREGVGDFFADVKERGLRRAIRDRAQDAAQNVREFFGNVADGIRDFSNDVKEDGLGVTVENRLNNLFEGNDGIIANAGRAVGQFFGDIQRDGFGPAVGERLNEVKENVGAFFQGAADTLGNFFGGIGDSLRENADRQAMVDALGGTTGLFGNLFKSDSEDFEELVDRYRAESGMEDARFNQVRRAMEQDTAFMQAELDRRGIELPSRSESVEDAIIRPDGTIIHTSPDDTILATKNNPTIVENRMDREVTSDMSGMASLNGTNYENKFDSMIQQLSTLIEVTSRSGGNIINSQSTPQFNFNNLRLGGS